MPSPTPCALAVQGQKLIDRHLNKLQLSILKVFTDKKLARKIDLVNWPPGKDKRKTVEENRVIEAIKTLKYLFKKLDITIAQVNEKKLRCLYCDAIDKYITLIKLTYNACLDVVTSDILMNLLTKLFNIQSLELCKCSRHRTKASNQNVSVDEDSDDCDAHEICSQCHEPLSPVRDSEQVTSSFSTMIPLINHMIEKLDKIGTVNQAGVHSAELKEPARVHGPISSVITVPSMTLPPQTELSAPCITVSTNSVTNKLCSCIKCNKILNNDLHTVQDLDLSNKNIVPVVCIECHQQIH